MGMGSASLGLGLKITATDMASGTLRNTGKAVGGVETKVKSLGMAAAKVFGGIVTSMAAVKGAMALTEPFGKFEQSIKAVSTIAVGGKEHLQDLTDTAIRAGIETQFSPKEAADGLLDLATAGQTASQAMKTLNPVLDLAAGSMGQLGVSESARAVVGTLNSYGLAADQAGEVTDKLLKITQMSNFQARDFATGLSKAAAAGGAFGQEMDDALIVVGLLRNANIDASSSATAYRESVRRLASDQGAQKAVAKAGVDIFDKQTGMMRQSRHIILDLVKATADMSAKDRNAIAAKALGARGLLAFNAVAKASFTTMKDGVEVTLKGADAIAEMGYNLESSKGTAETFREAMLDTFEGQKTLLKGTMETLQIVSGEGLAKAIRPIVTAITNSLNGVIKFIQEMNPGMRAAIGEFVGVLFGIVAGAGAFMAVAGAASLLGTMIFPLVGVALLLGSAFKHLLEDTGMVGNALESLRGFASKLLDQIKAFASAVWEGFQEVMPEIEDSLAALGESMGAFSSETDTASTMGKSLGRGLGKLVVLMIDLATAALDVVNALRPVVKWVVDLADSFGGFETVLGAVKLYFLYFAGVSIASKLMSIGSAAAMAGTEFLTLAGGMGAVQAKGFVGTLSAIKGGLGGVLTRIASSVGPAGAFGLMVAGIALAIDQFLKFKKELASFGDKNFWNELKHDMGLIDDDEYQRRFDLINGITKAGKGLKDTLTPKFVMQGMVNEPTFNMEADAARNVAAADYAQQLAGPIDYSPAGMTAGEHYLNAPDVGVPEHQDYTTSFMDGATAAAEAAASAAVKANPVPTPASATLTVDGQVLGELSVRYQNEAGNSSATPVEIL
jgi:TP901 family phage tail tape measure protein